MNDRGTLERHSAGGPIALYIDPPSHHFLEDRLFDLSRASLGGDSLLAPYLHVREHFKALGIGVRTADYIPREPGMERIVYVALGDSDRYLKLAHRPDVSLSAFFAMECPIVDPLLYVRLRRVRKYFKRIMTWGDSRMLEHFAGAPLPCESFRWPQSFEAVHEGLWQRDDRSFLVMINSNKLPAVYYRELYTERMRAVEFFGRTGDIDLYGPGWNDPSHRLGRSRVPWTLRRMKKYAVDWWERIHPDPLLLAARRVYKGHAVSKSETLAGYRYALCFENATLNGWITEKIFDCFFSGTIPVYWGAPDIELYVPPDCFIDMRQFSGYPELHQFLKSRTHAQLRRYRESARSYLESERFRPFTKAAFAELLQGIVSADTGVALGGAGDIPREATGAAT
jgi:alpha(1,3/1,4) fucosyltransferase